MDKTTWLLMVLMTGLGAPTWMGCGDDDGGGTDAGTGDAGAPMVNCPEAAPERESMMGACCYRVSNADRSDAPEFRVTGLRLTSPSTLGNPLVLGALAGFLDAELFNWLIAMDVTGTDVTIQTGYGERAADGTFAFVDGTAPMPGDVNRWNPIETAGAITGEAVTTDRLPGTFSLPIFDSTGGLNLELPLNTFQVESATMSEDRSCIGNRRASSYNTGDGTVSTFITVEGAMGVDVQLGCDDAGENCAVDASLCMFTAGMSSLEGNCDGQPRSMPATGGDCSGDPDPCAAMGGECVNGDTCKMWPVPPDSLCDESGCQQNAEGMTDVCDPLDGDAGCNAWAVGAQFSAHAVEISNH